MTTCANSVDPDKTACNKPLHQTPNCLPFCYTFKCLTETPICSNEWVQIQGWKSSFHKHRGEKFIIPLLPMQLGHLALKSQPDWQEMALDKFFSIVKNIL